MDFGFWVFMQLGGWVVSDVSESIASKAYLTDVLVFGLIFLNNCVKEDEGLNPNQVVCYQKTFHNKTQKICLDLLFSEIFIFTNHCRPKKTLIIPLVYMLDQRLFCFFNPGRGFEI